MEALFRDDNSVATVVDAEDDDILRVDDWSVAIVEKSEDAIVLTWIKFWTTALKSNEPRTKIFEDGHFWAAASLNDLANWTGLTRDRVRGAIDRLVAADFITQVRSEETLYRLNPGPIFEAVVIYLDGAPSEVEAVVSERRNEISEIEYGKSDEWCRSPESETLTNPLHYNALSRREKQFIPFVPLTADFVRAVGDATAAIVLAKIWQLRLWQIETHGPKKDVVERTHGQLAAELGLLPGGRHGRKSERVVRLSDRKSKRSRKVERAFEFLRGDSNKRIVSRWPCAGASGVRD